MIEISAQTKYMPRQSGKTTAITEFINERVDEYDHILQISANSWETPQSSSKFQFIKITKNFDSVIIDVYRGRRYENVLITLDDADLTNYYELLVTAFRYVVTGKLHIYNLVTPT